MEEGAGVKSILKGTIKTAIDLTLIEEIKTIFDSMAELSDKLSALVSFILFFWLWSYT